MPALRERDGAPLRIPECRDDRWVTADPQYLIAEVAKRHSEWRYFAPMVRTIKKWKDITGLDMKSLTAEILALHCLPRPETGVELTRPAALARFFTSAATQVMAGVSDPAGWCGEIQPELDRDAARAALLEAADVGARTLNAEQRGDYDAAVCLWRAAFGSDFPEPPGTGTGSAPAGAAVIAAPALIRRPVREGHVNNAIQWAAVEDVLTGCDRLPASAEPEYHRPTLPGHDPGWSPTARQIGCAPGCSGAHNCLPPRGLPANPAVCPFRPIFTIMAK